MAAALLTTLAATWALLGASAGAGGWAVTTLDAQPAPAAGETVAVGFTIRQHGSSPVVLDDVAIIVVGPDGARTEHPARSDGAAGHYLADVTFPLAGTVRWSVQQGWFAEQPLGDVAVGAAGSGASAGAPTSGGGSPLALRIGLPALSAVAAGWLVVRRLGVRERAGTVAPPALP